MRRLAIATLLGAFLLSGCGSAMFSTSESGVKTVPDAPGNPSTTEPTTAAPASGASKPGEPAATESNVYARKYLELVSPPNCEQGRFHALIDTEQPHLDDWPWYQQQVLPAVETWVASLTTFSEELAHADWPPELQDYVDRLIEDLSARVTYLQKVLASTDFVSYNKAWDAPYPHDESSAELRAKLGLPPNSDEPLDYC